MLLVLVVLTTRGRSAGAYVTGGDVIVRAPLVGRTTHANSLLVADVRHRDRTGDSAAADHDVLQGHVARAQTFAERHVIGDGLGELQHRIGAGGRRSGCAVTGRDGPHTVGGAADSDEG